MGEVSLFTAFIAGFISFLSPCVLPLVPGYLSFISGISIDELRMTSPVFFKKVAVSSLLFICGFSTIFIALGASATMIGQFLLTRLYFLNKLAGILIIVVGLHIMGVLKINLLYREKRIHAKRMPGRVLGPYIIGLAFALGWTPCIGPILAGILFLASTKETVLQGVFLLAVYSLGLGVPFLLTALGANVVFGFFNQIKKYMRAVEIASGILLIFIGVLIFTDNLTLLSSQLDYLNWFAW